MHINIQNYHTHIHNATQKNPTLNTNILCASNLTGDSSPKSTGVWADIGPQFLHKWTHTKPPHPHTSTACAFKVLHLHWQTCSLIKARLHTACVCVCICECVVKSEHTQKVKHTKVKWFVSFHLRQHCYKAPSLSLDVWLYVTAILWPLVTLSLKDVLISVS